MKRMLWCVPMLLLIASGAALRPAAAQADETRGWYVNGGLGLSHLDQEQSKQPKADLGFRVAATCGFRYNPHWALEFDSGLFANTLPEDPPTPKKTLYGVPLVVNALYDFTNKSSLTPFLGAGFGISVLWDDNSTGGDATIAFKGGLRQKVNERMAIGLDYTFFMLGISSAVIGEAVGDDTVNFTVRHAF